MLRTSHVCLKQGLSMAAKGSMRGGIPRIHYGWMRPGSSTRRRFEKMRNPFVDLETGTSLYYQSNREPVAAMAHEADSYGLKGMDNATDLYNEYKIVPDLYPEGFQWKHKLNTEYNQWRSNTWVTPDLIPTEHRGRLLANFQLHVCSYEMRVAKFSPKDHRQWIYCLLYVGTGKGIAGLGKAIAPSTAEAKQEAVRNAFANLQGFDLEQDGPTYPVRVNVNGCRVIIYPAKRLVANYFIADILCAFGLQAIGVKVNDHAAHKPRAPTHIATSLFEALRIYKSVSEVAASRGKVPHSLIYNIYPYLEEIRRRKGMMAMHPEGKDGLMLPDRVVDNRMPDHLKRGYYNDTQWKDFFAGDTSALTEPRMGLRGDQLRSLAPPTRRGTGRRTLAEVLMKVNKSPDDLGRTQVANVSLDRPVPTHAKQLFALH